MKSFTTLNGLVGILDKANIDTDQIIPKQFLRKIERSGFGVHLFHDWRFLDDAGTQENPEFVLNKPRYKGSSILIARDNFGCGSSREHAPWALEDFGFRSVIAPSYADIFFNNCYKNGMLPIVLSAEEVDELFKYVEKNEGATLSIDLETQTVKTTEGKSYSFKIDAFQKECLLKGLDDIGLTMKHEAKITSFEKKRRSDFRKCLKENRK